MSSDQNLDHHTNGLMPEPQPLIWIRAPSREQGAASGVAVQNARFAADLGVSARQVQGPAAGEPGQHATQEGGGQEREGGFDWSNGLNLAGIRSAPQAGGDTPVRTPQQRIALLHAQLSALSRISFQNLMAPTCRGTSITRFSRIHISRGHKVLRYFRPVAR